MEVELPYDYRPRPYQSRIWNHLVPDAYRKRAVVLAHRRWGKDLLCINIAAALSQIRVGTYWHVLPFAKQARAVVWNGMDEDGLRFQDRFPRQIVERINENEMRVHFKNGSIWQAIGGDDINRHVGTNPIFVTLSEWSLMDPAVDDYISPILLQNKGASIKIFTVRGENHAWDDLERAERLMTTNPLWLGVNQTVDHTLLEDGSRVISDEMIQQERDAGRSEQLIQQEYYNNPKIPIEGTYYLNELMRARKDGRITAVPYEPKLPVDTYWDIGYGDLTVIIFAQEYGDERRVIDVYSNSGEEVGHYAKVLHEKDYNYRHHHGPWDLDIKQLAAGGKSVYDVARLHGIRFIVTPQPRHVTDGIEQVRNIFPSLWFDEKKCKRLLSALSAYRKKPLSSEQQSNEKDEFGRKVVHFDDKPKHDWTSHYADAMRIMAWHIRKKRDDRKPPQEKAEDNYSYV